MLYHLTLRAQGAIRLLQRGPLHHVPTAMATLRRCSSSFFSVRGRSRGCGGSDLGQQIRSDGPETHKAKAGTPTMGGIPHRRGTPRAHPAVGDLPPTGTSGSSSSPPLAFGGIGSADDYIKIVKQRSLGPHRAELGWQFAAAIAIGLGLYRARN